MAKRRVEDLAEEAASVIHDCGLSWEETKAFLFAWILEVSRDGDVENIEVDYAMAKETLDKVLARASNSSAVEHLLAKEKLAKIIQLRPKK